jgi:acetylglutamate/LysW-gamma-L-alpha-aminoadipate kinase
MIVVKIGGGREIRHREILVDLKRHQDAGESFVVLHGANHEMGLISEQLGHPPHFVTSVSGHESRYTDLRTMDIFKMVYCGKVNKTLVALAHEIGINAIGLSGVDGALLRAERKKALRVFENGRRRLIRDDLSGRITEVNADLLRRLLAAGYVPLVCPPALSEEYEAVNVDGDRAAAMVAGALGAERLIVLSNVPGLLRDVNDEASLIARIARDQMGQVEPLALGRMKKKLLGAREALERNVRQVILADARVEHPIADALAGRGTIIE